MIDGGAHRLLGVDSEQVLEDGEERDFLKRSNMVKHLEFVILMFILCILAKKHFFIDIT